MTGDAADCPGPVRSCGKVNVVVFQINGRIIEFFNGSFFGYGFGDRPMSTPSIVRLAAHVSNR
ncbi:hypothetical protein C823_002665 [Eubacterium plexicaudatum ASF492]|nr:hypothetical protein C823_002665 [Eubacterium plexicaudatum ASF492]